MERRAKFNLTWQERAACRGESPGLFYPEDRYTQGTPEYAAYKAEITSTYCVGCPVRMRCLDFALNRPEKHGLWAGTDPKDRTRIARSGKSAAQAVHEMQRREFGETTEETA